MLQSSFSVRPRRWRATVKGYGISGEGAECVVSLTWGVTCHDTESPRLRRYRRTFAGGERNRARRGAKCAGRRTGGGCRLRLGRGEGAVRPALAGLEALLAVL